jgi:serine/threonine protein kinase
MSILSDDVFGHWNQWRFLMTTEMDSERRERPRATLKDGMTVAQYRIIGLIGTGTATEVYQSKIAADGHRVALKILLPHFINDNKFKTLFRHQAELITTLEHRNIISIYEVGEFRQRPFFVMEYLDGEPLNKKLTGKGLSVSDVINYAAQIGEGLAVAHRNNITHKDLKPANVFINAGGSVTLVDFGLSAIHGTDHMTRTAGEVGTICYTSPEQAAGKKIDHREDLFSLGVIIYEMLTGRMPFARGSLVATIQAIIQELPEPVTKYREDIPVTLQQIIARLLQKIPEKRYSTAEDFLSDLKSIT